LKNSREYYEREALLLRDHQREMYFGDPWNRYWHGTRLSHILEMIKVIMFRSCLDVGCAGGLYLRLISGLQNSKELYTVGLDVAKNYLLKAKKEVSEGSWVLGDSHKLPFRSNSFDLILCLEVLEHLSNPEMAFTELARVSGKYILISVAGENIFYHFAKKLRLVKQEDPYAKIGRGHIHEMKISKIVFHWASKAGYESLGSAVTCYFPASFLQRHRMPSFLIPIVRLIDMLIGKMPVIGEFAVVQIALLEKSKDVCARVRS